MVEARHGNKEHIKKGCSNKVAAEFEGMKRIGLMWLLKLQVVD